MACRLDGQLVATAALHRSPNCGQFGRVQKPFARTCANQLLHPFEQQREVDKRRQVARRKADFQGIVQALGKAVVHQLCARLDRLGIDIAAQQL